MTTSVKDPTDIWWLGALLQIRATAADTGGAYTLVEERLPAGFGSPVHVHSREEEAFLVLDGTLDFWVAGEQRQEVGAGGFIFLQRDVPHAFRVSSDGAHVLMVATPGGMESFFRAAGDAAPDAVLPPALDGPPDMQRLVTASLAAGVQILGPPPAPDTERLEL